MKEILKPEAYVDLCKFMEGQTVDAEGIYEDDLLRWIYKLPVVD